MKVVDPNSADCYGEFSHDSVNFPDQLFPTFMGELKNSTPGYQGSLSPELTGSEQWNYFLVESRYGVTSYAMEASHTIAEIGRAHV